jgi:hypothetical protein
MRKDIGSRGENGVECEKEKKNKSSKHYNVVVYKYKTNVKSIKSIGVNKKNHNLEWTRQH